MAMDTTKPPRLRRPSGGQATVKARLKKFQADKKLLPRVSIEAHARLLARCAATGESQRAVLERLLLNFL